MQIIDESDDDGVIARRFDLPVGEHTVPGMHWIPTVGAATYPTVCIAHGGFQHKLHSNVPELALQLVRNLGIGAVALDAPDHGDRIPNNETAKAAAKAARAAAVNATTGGGKLRPIDPERLAKMAARVRQHTVEWRALLDDLQNDDRWAAGPFGWWGVSMGTANGIAVTATDDRIACAVFGLNALQPTNEEHARAITVPILFLNQSDDELMTRDAALALWDAFASTDKTMHINPGGHVQVPRFERDASEAFFRRHLLSKDA